VGSGILSSFSALSTGCREKFFHSSHDANQSQSIVIGAILSAEIRRQLSRIFFTAPQNANNAGAAEDRVRLRENFKVLRNCNGRLISSVAAVHSTAARSQPVN
jgi:hypothetical protein